MHRDGGNAVPQRQIPRAAGEDGLPGQTPGWLADRCAAPLALALALAPLVEKLVINFLSCLLSLKPHSGGKRPGQALIENLCMKAVNQSIGEHAIFTSTDINMHVSQPTPSPTGIYALDPIRVQEEPSATGETIPPWCCVTGATLDPRRSPNSPRGSEIAPARTQTSARLSPPCER